MHYRIATLIFIRNEAGHLLLLKRSRKPNLGVWSPIGGKLDTASGESPVECAIRETAEETGLRVQASDLQLFSYIAEKGYEGEDHWLLFLFDCLKPIPSLPAEIDEGVFGFHREEDLGMLPLPETDARLLWPLYLKRRDGLIGMRVDCAPATTGGALQWEIECRVPQGAPGSTGSSVI
jgi:8-oxo-dGTP diphosphatase